jgi:branched-chain amino acid transport system ATP-binding protein
MLEVKNISSGYGKKQVLYDVSLQVKKGEVVLLTGGNGSGKSTILKCIYGLLPLWNGEIYFEGEKITGLKTSDLIKKGIVYIPQKNNYFENLTVQENLEVSGSIYSKTELKKKIKNVFENFNKLAELKKRTPFSLSGGERQLLAFGMALVHKPKLILFDEPLAGMDKGNTQIILDEILILNKKHNIEFLIIEHTKSLPEDFFNYEVNLLLGKISKTI